jgi:hypothetical protein
MLVPERKENPKCAAFAPVGYTTYMRLALGESYPPKATIEKQESISRNVVRPTVRDYGKLPRSFCMNLLVLNGAIFCFDNSRKANRRRIKLNYSNWTLSFTFPSLNPRSVVDHLGFRLDL